MNPDACQFEQYWRKRISDEFYAEHKRALRAHENWRAVYMAIASGMVLKGGPLEVEEVEDQQPLVPADCVWCSTPIPEGRSYCPSCASAVTGRANPYELHVEGRPE